MLIKNNPATAELHDDWRQRIKDEFPNINFSKSSDFLSIINYIDKAPLKFYSKEAFTKYLQILEHMKSKDPVLLATILKESESLLNIANKILTEINQKLIHDILLPEEHNDLINFIDQEIHYNLLKLYETPFYQLIYIIAKYTWLKDNKGTDGLDLFKSVEELIKIGFNFR